MGADELLRHAFAAGVVHDRGDDAAGDGFGTEGGGGDLRALYLRGLSGGFARGVDCGPVVRSATVGDVRRHDYRAGAFHFGDTGFAGVFSGFVDCGDGQNPLIVLPELLSVSYISIMNVLVFRRLQSSSWSDLFEFRNVTLVIFIISQIKVLTYL